MRLWLVTLVAVGMWHSMVQAAEPVTTGSLLREMTDLRALAQPADFTCRQFSSYDRASKTPEDHDAWFANGDAGRYLREEERAGRKEYVVMDADGPGAIVRIWSANPRGKIFFYLDGATEPTWEAPLADLLGGKVAGLPKPLAGERSRGWNLYFLIPYAKHCKVTCDEVVAEKHAMYYHIDYRTYPVGTAVETFAPKQLEQLTGTGGTARIAARLTEPEGLAEMLSSVAAGHWLTAPLDEPVTIAPGKSATFKQGGGPAYIVGFRCKLDSGGDTAALRKLVLTIAFDGEQTVMCPLPDFFGAGPQCKPYTSLPFVITADGELRCYWPMPYVESAVIGVENTGAKPIELALKVGVLPEPSAKELMRFHAAWRVSRDVPTRPFIDWNYLDVAGRGTFVGAAFSIANPVKEWWGEGDEKIFVDNEKFPSFLGTGTEDYYGYAWCCNEPFTHAYHNQPQCDGPANYGRTAVNRWHILDRIPFTQHFKFDMELWHWADKIKVPEMSVVAYWYAPADAGAQAAKGSAQPADYKLVEAPAYEPPRVDGALEGEGLKVVSVTAGDVRPQDIGPCSNEKHLWWTGAKPGDKLTVEFPAPAAGKYRLMARFLTAADYGIVQPAVNGEAAGAPIDLYHDGIKCSEEHVLGTFELKPTNTLTLEITGANEKAAQAFMCGLDYLKLEAAQ